MEAMNGALCLALDTTFDDTSVALLRGHREVLANVTLSQYADHAEFGGVVPERASRKHLEVVHPLIGEAMGQAGVTYDDVDYVAVSNLPGLLGSILVGLTVAKSVAYLLHKPLIGINHIEAHPYANFLAHEEAPRFPLIHLVAAGGHTLLIHQRDHFDWEIVGRSVDDAAGECVDKVAKMFGHPMPGGPVVDRMAVAHEPGPYEFPAPKLTDPDLDFSFSGLKTALRYFLRDHGPDVDEGPVLAAFFQRVADVLVAKTLRAAKWYGVEAVTVSGGLAASRKLRERFESACAEAGVGLYYPPPRLCTDNAAMVACLASFRHAAGRHDDLTLEGFANLVQ